MNRDPSNTMPDPNRQKDDRLKVILLPACSSRA